MRGDDLLPKRGETGRLLCGVCCVNELPDGWSFIAWCDRCLALGNEIKQANPGITLDETYRRMKDAVSRETEG